VTRRPKLDGTIAVVAVPGGDAVARRLVSEGASVVVTGTAGDEIGFADTDTHRVRAIT